MPHAHESEPASRDSEPAVYPSGTGQPPKEASHRPVTAPEFSLRKAAGIPISMVTCYDAWSAAIIAQTGIDSILVGDSGIMVMHGRESTIPAETDVMALHVAAVRRGAPQAFIIGDMPFLACLGSLDAVVSRVRQVMQAGANAVKIEGASDSVLEVIAPLSQAGVPVMGHLGLTPQSINQFGGYRVQGREQSAREQLKRDALALEAAGCFSLVLECVPAELGRDIARTLSIPAIGIGAGSGVDGQVLVLHDLLGLTPGRKPRFVRTYLDGAALIRDALQAYHEDVAAGRFPAEQESYR